LTALCHKSDTLTVAKLKSLILDIIHQISILHQLKNNNVLSKEDWFWRKQLKFRKDGNNVAIFMGNA
jgi:dynein heavy chain 2